MVILNLFRGAQAIIFLKVELDATGGTNYNLVSTTQMMSVPYALYAKNAGLDSAAIADMLASMNILSNFDKNCNYIFPEGINGEIIYFDFPQESNDPYIVPDGKKLYLTSFDGENFNIDNISSLYLNNNNKPTILSSGQELKKEYSYHPATGQGILINDNPDVEAITIKFEQGDNYIVPDGKQFYINNWQNGHPVIGSKVTYFHKWHSLPLIVKSGEILSIEEGAYDAVVNGYLVDEDFFADCGGVSSSSTPSNIDSAMVADMIANSGMSENSKSFKYPDGMNGTPITWHLPGNNYTRPEGKNLYITAYSGIDFGDRLRIDGLEIMYSNNIISEICVVGAGSVLSTNKLI